MRKRAFSPPPPQEGPDAKGKRIRSSRQRGQRSATYITKEGRAKETEENKRKAKGTNRGGGTKRGKDAKIKGDEVGEGRGQREKAK